MKIKIKCCSWQPIVLGCLFIWWFCLSEARINYIKECKSVISLLLVMGMGLLFFCQVIIQQKRDFETIAGWILLSAFVIRALYVIAAPYSISYHDLGFFSDLDSSSYQNGHFGYIEYLYHNHKLFDFDPTTVWGFYNPPGFHILGAIVLKITHGVFGIAQPLCFESMQALTLFFSSMSVWMMFRIMQEFSFQKKYVLMATAFIAYFPFFTIYATTLSNDIQGLFFTILAIWYTIRWYRMPSMKNILIIALAIGLGMFTKLNVVLISIGIAWIFAFAFFKYPDRRKKYCVEFFFFLLVSVPIGLFVPIRNLIKFQVPLSYIQRITDENNMYLGNSEIINRLGIVIDQQLSYAFATLNANIEQNIWIQTIRTALFDELRLDVAGSLTDNLGQVMLWGNLILAVVLNFVFFKILFTRKKAAKYGVVERELTISFALVYLTMVFSYIKFCFEHPFVCTMNFRYIPVVLIILILSGLTVSDNIAKNNGNPSGERYLNLFLGFVGILIVASFAFNICMIRLV